MKWKDIISANIPEANHIVEASSALDQLRERLTTIQSELRDLLPAHHADLSASRAAAKRMLAEFQAEAEANMAAHDRKMTGVRS